MSDCGDCIYCSLGLDHFGEIADVCVRICDYGLPLPERGVCRYIITDEDYEAYLDPETGVMDADRLYRSRAGSDASSKTSRRQRRWR